MEQSEPPTRELTLEEAVSNAILLQKNKQLVEAQELARVAVGSLSGSGDTYPTCGFRLSARAAGDAHRQVDRQGGS